MIVSIGARELELGGPHLTTLRESNDILDDETALRQRMEEDGYLFIRGFHDREQVLRAEAEMLDRLHAMGRLKPGTDPRDGIVGDDNKGAMLPGFDPQTPELLKVVNAERVMGFFDRFLGGPSLTYDFKWIRAVSKEGFTGAHYDIVYMGRGTKQLYTVWTPIGDVTLDKGGLVLCLGSQHFRRIRDTYGQMDVDRDHVTGWFTEDPLEIVEKFGGRWATAEFRAGDALIFNMFMLHGSLTNKTDRYRISVDTRYQLASEPIDERWYGKGAKGHYSWMEGETVPMEKAREQWGI